MKILKNPQSINYINFKKWATGTECMWSYIPSSTAGDDSDTNVKGKQKDLPFYTRTILKRPENKYRYSRLEHADTNETHGVIDVLNEILEFNDIGVSSYLRISLNCVHPEKEVYNTLPHTDHQIPHGNIIIYLTDAGGKTFVESEDNSECYDAHDPHEDDIILFSGKHFMQNPLDKRRVILVATIQPLWPEFYNSQINTNV